MSLESFTQIESVIVVCNKPAFRVMGLGVQAPRLLAKAIKIKILLAKEL